MMARELGITAKRVGARITEARDHIEAALRKLGHSDVDREGLGKPYGSGIPDAALLNLVRGLPDLLWRGGKGQHTSKLPRKKRGHET